MTKREEFDRAVNTIQQLIRDGAVTKGFGAVAKDSDEVIGMVVISPSGRPKSIELFDHTCNGDIREMCRLENAFTIHILEDGEQTKRLLTEARRQHQDLIGKIAHQVKELSNWQMELAELQNEIDRLGGK
jgi:hypothetical protein